MRSVSAAHHPERDADEDERERPTSAMPMRSPSHKAEQTMPITGKPGSPSEVVAAGSARLMVVMAHEAGAMPNTPP